MKYFCHLRLLTPSCLPPALSIFYFHSLSCLASSHQPHLQVFHYLRPISNAVSSISFLRFLSACMLPNQCSEPCISLLLILAIKSSSVGNGLYFTQLVCLGQQIIFTAFNLSRKFYDISENFGFVFKYMKTLNKF